MYFHSGMGVTHVPIQVLPLNYQCCMTAQIPNIRIECCGERGGGGGRESGNVGGGGGRWRRSNTEGQMGEREGRKRGNSQKNDEMV